MTRSVTVIPATLNPMTGVSKTAVQRRKTAGYARVSTDSEEQKTSYEAQVSYYTNYIQSRSDWEFVGVYTDEGITAVNTKHRNGFKEMVEDALAGKIDLIITKSVSRFARNTVDSLVTIRKLKEYGVEVYFEKENIYTFDGKGELLLTIMSSLAQEESRSISENVTWGQRKRFADGKVSLPYKHFLGYAKGENGIPVIVPEEAETVRKIYRLFISGQTTCGIAKILTTEGVPTPSGKSKWQTSTVQSILTNEKYMGAALLQKRFTVDFLTKKMKINEGEVPQYYVKHSHEAIISPEDFEIVQAEMVRRKGIGRSYSGGSIFGSKIVCGDCGCFYGAKVWNSNSKYRKIIWQCNNKFKTESKCMTPHVTEDKIKSGFIEAMNRLLTDKARLLEDCEIILHTLTDCTEIELRLQEIYAEIEVIMALTKQSILENATVAQNQNAYLEKYSNFELRYEKLKSEAQKLEAKKAERKSKADAIGAFMFELSELNPISTFDEKLWTVCVDLVRVYSDNRLIFVFRNGAEIEIS
ncbi:MAG: recombinase family protein [Clostridia bacterium]|nr:recombinase family protein [Clostridia bacterium]